VIKIDFKGGMLKVNGLEARGECSVQWSLADDPVVKFSEMLDISQPIMKTSGDLFTSFFVEISPLTSDCSAKTCSLIHPDSISSQIDDANIEIS
jgi:hypothetical protein